MKTNLLNHRDTTLLYEVLKKESSNLRGALRNHADATLLYDALKKESSKLRGALRNRADATIESVAEECERTVLAGQRELTVDLVDRAAKRLRDVESALHRFVEGSYGACTDCDEPMSVRRLTAIPWARRCVRCQEVADREAAPSIPGRTHEHTVSGPFRYGGVGSGVLPARAGKAR